MHFAKSSVETRIATPGQLSRMHTGEDPLNAGRLQSELMLQQAGEHAAAHDPVDAEGELHRGKCKIQMRGR
jgi:hypothetical protein